MFDTGEWNDDTEAQTLTESLVSAQKEKALDVQQKKGALSRKKRLKRNRELLEILQTLKSTNTQNPDLPPPPPEDVLPLGKQKKVTPDFSLPISPPAGSKAPPPDTGKHLSRQQWKNKMKNKRKKRNKFKACEEKNMEEDLSKDHGGSGKTSKKDGGAPGSGSHRTVQPVKKKRSMIGEEPDLPGVSSTDQGAGQKKALRKEKTSEESKSDPSSPRTSAVEKARLKKLKKMMNREAAESKKDLTTDEKEEDTVIADESNPPEEEIDRSASLRLRMEQRLHSARFRYINEQLYTSDSQEAVQLFQSDPEAFTLYHTGFSQQVQRWPVNPINEIIKYVKNRPSSLVVADFGCGDAQLARSVRNQVHSFDLVALNDRVTVCDMAQVPLSDGTVDIAVFCLSLMGKNLGDFLKEANRVLKLEGILLVAEVSSRFDDVRQFTTAMSQLGFKCMNKNTENSHFYLFEFHKVRSARDASKHPGLKLKPCLYKKR